jgi:hypothetical protein
MQYKYSSPTQFRFLLIENQLKEITLEGKTWALPRFELKSADDSTALTKDFLRIDLPSDGIDEIRALLKDVNPLKPKWDLQLHYLLLSEEHYTFGDSRLSIIDMDIAIDLCIRKYLRAKTKLERPPFDALLEDTSTGQLLTAAKLISEGKTLENIIVFEKLHNLRNTILHRYQRSISREHVALLLKAKEAIREFDESTA